VTKMADRGVPAQSSQAATAGPTSMATA
jgi:hypothetical protein